MGASKLQTTMKLLCMVILTAYPCVPMCRDRMMEYDNHEHFWIHSCFKCDSFIFGDNVVVMKLFEKTFQIIEKLRMAEENKTRSRGLNSDGEYSTTINPFPQSNTNPLEKTNYSKNLKIFGGKVNKNQIKPHRRIKKAYKRCWNILSSRVNTFSIPKVSTLGNKKLIPTKSFISPHNCRHFSRDFKRNKTKIKPYFDEIKNVNDSRRRNKAGSKFYSAHKQFNEMKSNSRTKRNLKNKNENTKKVMKKSKAEENERGVNDSGDVFLSNNKELNALSSFKYLYFNRHYLVINSDDGIHKSENTTQDNDNYENKDHFMKLLCLSLKVEESRCIRWSTCCLHAHQCCQRMQLERDQLLHKNHVKKLEIYLNNGNHNNLESYNISGGRDTTKRCVTTWDGFACWASEKGGNVVRQSCPVFLGNISPQKYAVKECTEDGWKKRKGKEWTDYTDCINTNFEVLKTNVSIAMNCLSVVALVPALFIFLYYRDLRRQVRIKVHIHLFFSLLLFSLFSIIWFSVLHFDALQTTSHTLTIAYQNPLWCRLLAMCKTHTTFTCFAWTLCEALFLHQLLSRSFNGHVSIALLVFLGWVIPCLPTIIYYSFRVYLLNASCWSKQLDGHEWIIYGPNIACLVINTVLLADILRILVFQLHSHPREPSSFRRGVKAVAMLIPLFGLQLVLTIYRPSPQQQSHTVNVFSIVTAIVTNSQGIFVSLLYCYFNGEVILHLKRGLGVMGGCVSMEDRSKRSDVPSMRGFETANHTEAFKMSEIQK